MRRQIFKPGMAWPFTVHRNMEQVLADEREVERLDTEIAELSFRLWVLRKERCRLVNRFASRKYREKKKAAHSAEPIASIDHPEKGTGLAAGAVGATP